MLLGGIKPQVSLYLRSKWHGPLHHDAIGQCPPPLLVPGTAPTLSAQRSSQAGAPTPRVLNQASYATHWGYRKWQL